MMNVVAENKKRSKCGNYDNDYDNTPVYPSWWTKGVDKSVQQRSKYLNTCQTISRILKCKHNSLTGRKNWKHI